MLLYNIIYISLLQRLLGIKSPLIVAGGKKNYDRTKPESECWLHHGKSPITSFVQNHFFRTTTFV